MGSAAAGSIGAGHRVLLVRAWSGGASGGGCCSGADGSAVRVSHHAHVPDPGPTVAAQWSAAAYLALRDRFPGLDVTVVDARNWAWLGPAVYRDARRSGRGRLAAVREAARATTPGCFVVDGVVEREVHEPVAAVAVVARRLAASATRLPHDPPGTRA